MAVTATVEGIRRYTIHGEPYVVLYYSLTNDPETFRNAQLSADALPDRLRVGEQVLLTLIGEVVAGVRRSDSSAGETP